MKPAHKRHPRVFGFLLLTLAMAGWGITFGMNRWMLEDTPLKAEPWPGLSLSVIRFGLAAVALLPWAALIVWRRYRMTRSAGMAAPVGELTGLAGSSGSPAAGGSAVDILAPLNWRRWMELVVLGLLSVVGYHLLANSAQSYASAGLNAVLHQMTPVVAFIGGLIALKERVSTVKLAGLAVASVGAIWYSLVEAGSALKGDNIPLAALLIFLVALDWTFYLVLAKRALRYWSGMELAVVANAIGSLLLVVLALVLELIPAVGLQVDWSILCGFDGFTWFIMLYLSLVAGVICYLFYNAGLKRVESSQAAVFGYLLVPVALVTGLFLPGDLREELSVTKILAAAMIVAGVYLVTKQRPRGRRLTD